MLKTHQQPLRPRQDHRAPFPKALDHPSGKQYVWCVTADDTGSKPAALPALVLVSADPSVRDLVGAELNKRYGADYLIVAVPTGPTVAVQLEELGAPVAVALARIAENDPSGIDVLAAVGEIFPQALRTFVVRWGELEAAESVFEAIALGKADGWVFQPQVPGDEEFHLGVTELLDEWANRHETAAEAVQVIGERWSQRSQELRDMFVRNRVPTGFHDASSPKGQELLAVARAGRSRVAGGGAGFPAGAAGAGQSQCVGDRQRLRAAGLG